MVEVVLTGMEDAQCGRGGDVDAEHADGDHIGGGEAVYDMRCISPTVESFEHRTSEVQLPLGADVKVAAQQGGRLIAVLPMSTPHPHANR